MNSYGIKYYQGKIGVSAKDDVVTLTDTIPNYFKKIQVEHTAGRVPGVKAIAEELKAKLPNFNQRTDTHIPQSASNALARYGIVPSCYVYIRNAYSSF